MLGIYTFPTKKCEKENNAIKNTIRPEEITKCEIDIPISSQLPESLTKKKKLRVITSVIDNTKTNKEKGGRSRLRARIPKIEERMKKGKLILKSKRAPMKKGLKIVTNRVIEATLKLEIDATFPVPKNPRFRKTRKKNAVRTSCIFILRYKKVLPEVEFSLST